MILELGFKFGAVRPTVERMQIGAPSNDLRKDYLMQWKHKGSRL